MVMLSAPAAAGKSLKNAALRSISDLSVENCQRILLFVELFKSIFIILRL